MVKGLYVHLPFCTKKCPYCHFFVIKDATSKKDQLLTALLDHHKTLHLPSSEIASLYFGGGTPTLFGLKRFETLLAAINPREEIEVTIEANPETITFDLMKGLRSLGINRVSIGVQSLIDLELKILGRTHTARESEIAVKAAAKAGFDNITIDLMMELPHQTLESFETTLDRALDLPITHLSLYNLTFEESTPFYRKRKQLQKACPSSSVGKEMLDLAIARIEGAGLKRYEISAFAKEGQEAVHNSRYWRGEPFEALGPSAFGYIDGRRFRNHRNFPKYIDAIKNGQSPIDFEETLLDNERINELLMVELRLFKGVDLDEFAKRHGPIPHKTHQSLDSLVKDGYLEENERIRLTERGRLFYDTVAEAII